MIKRINRLDPVEYARRLIARRPRSRREMEQRLSRRYPADAVERAMSSLVENGLLDDTDFCRWWIQERLLTRPSGRLLLIKELIEKGVDRETIDDTLIDFRQELDESQLALEVAKATLKRYEGLPQDVGRRRLGAFLTRRGFASEAVREAVCQCFGDYRA